MATPDDISGFNITFRKEALRYLGRCEGRTANKLTRLFPQILKGDIARVPTPLGLALGLEYVFVEDHMIVLSINYSMKIVVVEDIDKDGEDIFL